MTVNKGPLIIIGASARAAAQSAKRAGYEPWCIDLFADRDLQAIAPVKRCHCDKYPLAILKMLDDAPPDAPVLYTGALENHPHLLESISEQRTLLGCSAKAVRLARDPAALASMPAIESLGICRVYHRRPLAAMFGSFLFKVAGGRRYLIKPCRGTSGRGIRHWSAPMPVPKDHYLQQYIEGAPISAMYHSDGWSATLLATTEQIIGDGSFGADDFQFVGNIGPASLTSDQRQALRTIGVALAQRHDLRGVFGIDAILDHRGVIWPVEVNPRYTASIELVERALGIAALSDHPLRQRDQIEKEQSCQGKAIVFAKSECQIPDLYDSFDQPNIADVPQIGETIRTGDPICTVFAVAEIRDTCLAKLYEMADKVYTLAQQTSPQTNG